MSFSESRVCVICVSFLSNCLALALSSGPTIAPTYLVLLLIVVCGNMSSTVNVRSARLVLVGVSMVLLLPIGAFFAVFPASDVLLAIRRVVLGVLRFSRLDVRALFLSCAGLGTPSRALAAFALTLSLDALDVDSGVADDRAPRWRWRGSPSSSAMLPASSLRLHLGPGTIVDFPGFSLR